MDECFSSRREELKSELITMQESGFNDSQDYQKRSIAIQRILIDTFFLRDIDKYKRWKDELLKLYLEVLNLYLDTVNNDCTLVFVTSYGNKQLNGECAYKCMSDMFETICEEYERGEKILRGYCLEFKISIYC